MKRSDFNRSISELPFASDEAGRLYDPQMRQRVAEIPRPEVRSAIEAFAALGMAAKLVHLERERLAERHGLSEGRLGLLACLRHRSQGIPLGELASMLNVSPRNVTGLIDNLERDGLATRVPDPADRRSILANLTARGRERLDAVWQQAAERQFSLAEGMAPEELEELRHLCLLLVHGLKRSAAVR